MRTSTLYTKVLIKRIVLVFLVVSTMLLQICFDFSGSMRSYAGNGEPQDLPEVLQSIINNPQVSSDPSEVLARVKSILQHFYGYSSNTVSYTENRYGEFTSKTVSLQKTATDLRNRKYFAHNYTKPSVENTQLPLESETEVRVYSDDYGAQYSFDGVNWKEGNANDEDFFIRNILVDIIDGSLNHSTLSLDSENGSYYVKSELKYDYSNNIGMEFISYFSNLSINTTKNTIMLPENSPTLKNITGDIKLTFELDQSSNLLKSIKFYIVTSHSVDNPYHNNQEFGNNLTFKTIFNGVLRITGYNNKEVSLLDTSNLEISKNELEYFEELTHTGKYPDSYDPLSDPRYASFNESFWNPMLTSSNENFLAANKKLKDAVLSSIDSDQFSNTDWVKAPIKVDYISNTGYRERSPEAKKLIDSIYNAWYKGAMFSGQHIWYSWDDMKMIYNMTGEIPLILGMDFQDHTQNAAAAPDPRVMNEALRWGSAGGIVQFSWHWMQKTPSGGSSFYKYSTYNNSGTTFDIAKAVIPGTWENKVVDQDMEKIAWYLTEFKKNNIPVLWRPLHESCGPDGNTWFWWDARSGLTDNQQPVVKLYEWMYKKFVYDFGLTNLVWVWSSPIYKPQSHYVDIVGYDSYHVEYSPNWSMYNHIGKMYGWDKPVAMTETFHIPDLNSMNRDGVKWAWFLRWNTTDFTSDWFADHLKSQNYNDRQYKIDQYKKHLYSSYKDSRVIKWSNKNNYYNVKPFKTHSSYDTGAYYSK